MNQGSREILYPILISQATPPAIEMVLADYGIPTRRVSVRISNSHETGDGPEWSILGIRDRAEFDFPERFRVRQPISWQDLLAENATIDAIENELDRSETCRWHENGVDFEESIARTPVAEAIVERLKAKVEALGIPWLHLAPWPAEFDGAFNFRFDLDEPDLDDWKKVVRTVDELGLEPGATWFLCTQAALQVPEAVSLLAGREVGSHGHWHHVHSADSRLNAANVQLADRYLHERHFRPIGFAAPGGRIVPDLLRHLSGLNYRYLAGLASLSGMPVRTSRTGLHLVHSLPVCEGAFLEAGIDSVETVVDGYLAAASRAIGRGLPVFWFGHPDRRLGRKPAILEELARSIRGLGRFWHVGLGTYSDWIHARNSLQLTASRTTDDLGTITLSWQSDRVVTPAPAMWIDTGGRRCVVECAGPAGRKTIRPNVDATAQIPQPLPEPEFWPVSEKTGWRSAIREALDWERETPVEMLRGGPATRRIKGLLRRATDRSWHARFEPLRWPSDDPSRERAA